MATLWYDLHDLFDTDDGSLPEVHVTNLPEGAVIEAYAFIRRHSQITTAEPYFWSILEQREVALDSIPNPALLVVRGEAECFHCVFSITMNRVTIPDLGVFIEPNAILLDYRMGRDWNEGCLTAFFQLLNELTRNAPNAKVELDPVLSGPDQARFQRAWDSFRTTGAA